MEFGRGRGIIKKFLSEQSVMKVDPTNSALMGCGVSVTKVPNFDQPKNSDSRYSEKLQWFQPNCEAKLSNKSFSGNQDSKFNNNDLSIKLLSKTTQNEQSNPANEVGLADADNRATDLDMYCQDINDFVMQAAENNHKTKEIAEEECKVPIKNFLVDDKTSHADKDWHLFNCDRRINKILSNVTEDNINTVFNELENFIEEAPLLSRYVDCSEIKLIIEVLVKKSIQKEEFLPFGPCLLKLVSEHSAIEFQKYFPDIINAHRQENITVCSSDNMLSTNGKNFCRLLGHMLSLPRQTGKKFYETVLPIVKECVKRWNYPESNEILPNSFQECLAIVFALSTKYLLLEICKQMISCDKEISKQMKSFLCFLRESILNNTLSRKVREAFLDAMIEVQTSIFIKQVANKETLESLQGDINVVDEVEENRFTDLKVEAAASSEKFSESINEKDIYSSNISDPFLCVKQLLREQDDLAELIPVFIKHKLDDIAITLPTIRTRMEAANIKRLTAFHIDTVIKKTNFEKLRSRAIESITSNLPHLRDNPILTEPSSTLKEYETSQALKKFPNTDENSSFLNKTTSSNSTRRIAINFSKPSYKLPDTSLCEGYEFSSGSTLSNNKYDQNEIDEEVDPKNKNGKVFEKTPFNGSKVSQSIPMLDTNKEDFIENQDKIDPKKMTENFIASINEDEPDVLIEDDEYENNFQVNATGNENTRSPYRFKKLQFETKGRGFMTRPEVSSNLVCNTKNYQRNDSCNETNYRGNARDRFSQSGPKGVYRGRGNRGYNKDFQKVTRSNNQNQNQNQNKNILNFELACHGKASSEANVEDKQPTDLMFGMRQPKVCLRCQSSKHLSDECTVSSPFFG